MPEHIVLKEPWSLNPTPEVLDDMIVEVVDTQASGYRRIAVGEPHPNRDPENGYPGFVLCDEKPMGQFRSRRTWSNQLSNQDLYNYDIGYSGESNSHPIYVRRYIYRRDQYTPILKGANMTGVWQIRVTNGGDGYDPALPPSVTIAGGGGATAVAFVDTGGVIRWVRVTAEGGGYDTPPVVTIAPPLSGTTATAVAVIQQSFTNALASITVTAPGSYASVPKITFTGDDGDGNATAVAQLNGTSLAAIVIENAGRDFVSAPAVHISDSGGGTAIAVLEELRLSCVKEDVSQLPSDDPRQSIFVLVTRVFETTPGPVLRDVVYDWKLRTTVFIRKRIVLSSSVPLNALSMPTVVAGTRTEYQSTPNANRSIQIISSIGTAAPASYQFFSTVNYRFPDVLQPTPTITMAYVENSLSGNFIVAQEFGLKINITEGYAGPCKARITRKFTYTPNEVFFDALPAIVAFQPQAHTISTYFTVATASQTIARVGSFGIPQTIHPAYTFLLDPNFFGTGAVGLPAIPATTPTSIPTGFFPIDINPTLDERFGVWVYDIVEVKHP